MSEPTYDAPIYYWFLVIRTKEEGWHFPSYPPIPYETKEEGAVELSQAMAERPPGSFALVPVNALFLAALVAVVDYLPKTRAVAQKEMADTFGAEHTQ